MTRPPTPLQLTSRERLMAWVVTGPVGHFVAGTLDLLGAIAQIAAARARARAGR